MKNIKAVCELLKLTDKQVKNLIDPARNHRTILDELGCYVRGNKYLFSDDGVRYLAYQYMNKSRECFYYVYPDRRLGEMKPNTVQPVKKVKVKKNFNRITNKK